MAADTESRLREHAKHFDGLLALIPAKLYFPEDNSDQWQRRKQTKEQAKAAKRAKLDPTNAKSAKDVFDENARKRKREQGSERAPQAPTAKEEKIDKPAKKQKLDQPALEGQAVADGSSVQKLKAENAQSKKERKKAKAGKEERAKAKAEERKRNTGKAKDKPRQTETEADESNGAADEDVTGHFEDLDGASSPIAEGPTAAESVASSRSPVFDTPAVQSGTSSISSFPDVATGAPEKPPAIVKDHQKPSQEELKLRLQKRLQELRAARKADNEDGTPARSRQDLIEERRKKDEERKERKKELRKQQKEEELRKKEEEMSHGSPLMSPSVRSPGRHGLLSTSEQANNFTFGRVAFENGQSMTADLGRIIDLQKKKGPKDIKRALETAETRQEKLSAMDSDKRADIAEKDMWLNAKKRVHGERVRDDVSLLKKTLKRKEKQKKKSEKAWDDRIEGVRKGKEARQQKREENIQKRKDERANKGKKKKGIKSKPKARAGFEGSFRAGGKKS